MAVARIPSLYDASVCPRFELALGRVFPRSELWKAARKFLRRTSVECPVRARGVVARAPCLDDVPCVGEREEAVRVQALVAQSAGAAFDMRILDGFLRTNEMQLRVAVVRPLIKRAALKLGAVVDDNAARGPVDVAQPLQRADRVGSGRSRTKTSSSS
jgi:hypothetical protein